MLNFLRQIIKIYILPYRPHLKTKSEWEREYSEGMWNYLDNKKEGMRNGLIANYIRDNFNNSVSILDLGCGSGVLQKKLSGYYSYYTGVDISDEAINSARGLEDEKTMFRSEDLTSFIPKRKYDCIVFNESLYYLDNPLKTLGKYKSFLNEDGVIIISMWNYKEGNNLLWKSINSSLIRLEGLYLKLDSGNSWHIGFYH